jgi:hypothetical protein
MATGLRYQDHQYAGICRPSPTRHGGHRPDAKAGLAPLRRAATTAFLAVAALAVSGCAGTASAAPAWTQVSTGTVDSLTGAEGVASEANGTILHRGLGSIPAKLRLEGWNHIGDPDVAEGYVFDAYQGAADGRSKMFSVTTPDGKLLEYTHTLDPGELFNNSFAAVSPDGQWLVSGEFGQQKRLQVFPAPLLNHSTPPNGGNLPQAGQITLSRTVSNIQGCDFVTATELICTSDDAAKDVLKVVLPRPLDGKPTTGQVTTLFQIPQVSKCKGAFEAEGDDFDTATQTLRVQIVQPGLCELTTNLIAYRLEPS